MFSSNATAYQPTVCASYPYRYTLHTEKCDFSLGSKKMAFVQITFSATYSRRMNFFAQQLASVTNSMVPNLIPI